MNKKIYFILLILFEIACFNRLSALPGKSNKLDTIYFRHQIEAENTVFISAASKVADSSSSGGYLVSLN